MYTSQSGQLLRQKACFLHGKNFLWSMNTPASCTSKAGVHRNRLFPKNKIIWLPCFCLQFSAKCHKASPYFAIPLLRVFPCLLFFIYKHQKGQHVGCNANPITNLPHTTGSFHSSVGQFFDFGSNTHWRVRHGI